MPRINVSIILTAVQVRDYYRGTARYVVARARDGRTVQLPIRVLHKFISPEGIRGQFVINTDENYKFKSISNHAAPGRMNWMG